LDAGARAGAGERRIARGGCVGDLDRERVVIAADVHGDCGAGGVAQGVGQGLLDDVVGGLGERGRETLALSVEAHSHVEPAARRAGHELVDQGEVGRGAARGLVAEERDESTHVLLGLARGARDRVERVRGRLRVAGRQTLPGACLHDHDADRVGDDVVQLGGDPRTFVADRERGVRLALLLELVPALGERCGHQLALAQRSAAAPGRGGEEQRRHDRLVREQHRELQRADQREQRGDAAPVRLPAPGAESVRCDERRDTPGHSGRRDREQRDDRAQPRRARPRARGRERSTHDGAADDPDEAQVLRPGGDGSRRRGGGAEHQLLAPQRHFRPSRS
jgi:hypothetical protein